MAVASALLAGKITLIDLTESEKLIPNVLQCPSGIINVEQRVHCQSGTILGCKTDR